MYLRATNGVFEVKEDFLVIGKAVFALKNEAVCLDYQISFLGASFIDLFISICFEVNCHRESSAS